MIASASVATIRQVIGCRDRVGPASASGPLGRPWQKSRRAPGGCLCTGEMPGGYRPIWRSIHWLTGQGRFHSHLTSSSPGPHTLRVWTRGRPGPSKSRRRHPMNTSPYARKTESIEAVIAKVYRSRMRRPGDTRRGRSTGAGGRGRGGGLLLAPTGANLHPGAGPARRAGVAARCDRHGPRSAIRAR